MKKLYLWIIFSAFILTTSSLLPTVSGESTSLSLQPTLIEVPFIDLDHGEIVVSINLTFNNISDLKKFTLILTFDGNMLEYYTDHAGDWGYSGSRSTNPQHDVVTMSGELTDGREISGSGTFYTFAFNVVSVGSSQILLQYIYLEDKSGSAIPYIISNDNATIEILPLEIWVDGEYAELKSDYDLLLDDFQTLNATYEALLSDYNSLDSTYQQLVSDYNSLTDEFETITTDYNTLETEHAELKSDYDLLLDDFQTLNATYEALLSDYNSLNDEYEELKTDYDTLETEYAELKSHYDSLNSTYNLLSSEHDKLSEELVTKDKEFSTNTNLMYIFIVTTIVLAAAAAYFSKKKEKKL